MKHLFVVITLCLIFTGCDSDTINGGDGSGSSSYIFVAGEGNFSNPGSGSLTYINDSGELFLKIEKKNIFKFSFGEIV